MSKISQYAQNTSPALTDYVIGVQASGPTTKRYVLSDLVTLFLNNIPATEGSLQFVSSGLVWSGDSYAGTRAASMTSGRLRAVTSFLAISAVTARTFTASKDTYVDVLDNLDGTGTLVYTEVTNNAASPVLASNSIRIGIIVTGATTIAAVGSINQGQEDKILPIASSVAYSVADSIGNLICPRDPDHRLLCYRQSIANQTGISTTSIQLTGLSAPVNNIPTGRKLKISAHIASARPATAFDVFVLQLWEGTVASGTELGLSATQPVNAGTTDMSPFVQAVRTPSATSATYNAGGQSGGTGGNTTSINASSTQPAFIMIELE